VGLDPGYTGMLSAGNGDRSGDAKGDWPTDGLLMLRSVSFQANAGIRAPVLALPHHPFCFTEGSMISAFCKYAQITR